MKRRASREDCLPAADDGMDRIIARIGPFVPAFAAVVGSILLSLFILRPPPAGLLPGTAAPADLGHVGAIVLPPPPPHAAPPPVQRQREAPSSAPAALASPVLRQTAPPAAAPARPARPSPAHPPHKPAPARPPKHTAPAPVTPPAPLASPPARPEPVASVSHGRGHGPAPASVAHPERGHHGRPLRTGPAPPAPPAPPEEHGYHGRDRSLLDAHHRPRPAPTKPCPRDGPHPHGGGKSSSHT